MAPNFETALPMITKKTYAGCEADKVNVLRYTRSTHRQMYSSR